MEERSIRENLGERVAELEEQVGGLRESNQSLESERSTQAMNVDGLQRALKELQESMSNTMPFLPTRLIQLQLESKSLENWSRALRLYGSSSKSRYRKHRRLRIKPRSHSNRRRPNLSACFRSKVRSRRRTSSSANSVTKL